MSNIYGEWGQMNSSNVSQIDNLVADAPNKSKISVTAITIGLIGIAIYLALSLFLMLQFNKHLPDDFEIKLFGFSKTVHNIHDRFYNAYLLIFVLFPAAFAVEAIFTGWKKSSLYRILLARTESIKLDLACLAYSQLQIYNIVKLILTFGLAMIIGKWINAHLVGIFPFAKVLSQLPIYAQIPLFYVLYTLCDYWDHRIEHTKYFWVFHRFHHSAEDFCMVTTMRQHPVSFVAIFIINLPMAILGASTSAMIWVNLLVTIVGMFQHSNIDSDYGWFGKWLFQSPNHHRKHHELDISGGVYNFGLMPLWDKVFGTWKQEADQTIVIGVDKPYKHGYGFFGDVLRDYIDFFKGLMGQKVDPYDWDAAKEK